MDRTAPQCRRMRLAAAVVAWCLAATTAYAGGGPENVLLVVNQRSWSSLTIANHYAALRKIPPQNVLYVDWADDNEKIDAATLRAKLLGPLLAEIERRKIDDHIDYVVYSSDFPWSVDCSADAAAAGEKLPPVLDPVASLTGLTYHYRLFLGRKLDYLLLDSNKYYRPATATEPPATQAFHSWYGWAVDGRLLEAGGDRYLLSSMLGVTCGRGNSTAEIVAALEASSSADYSRPAGTVYFCRNDDIRSKTRHEWFPAAVAAIEQAGVEAEIVDGILPAGKSDAAGLMVGIANFSLEDAGTKLRPGAIAEHLTSSGGVLYENAGQTPIASFLSAKAAATSGAVTEPFAVPNKFPTAYMHLHYARGCSAAEAYYQSVHGPYQLLFLGDALCRPWADRALVEVAGLDAGQTVRGTVSLAPSGTFMLGDAEGGAVARFEIYVDGLLLTTCRPGEAASFDSRQLPDGYHEVRMIAVQGEPIETRGGVILPIGVANSERTIVLERVDDKPVRWDEPLTLRAKADGAFAIVVANGTRKLGQIRGGEGELTIEPRTLGLGPVRLQAFAVGNLGPSSNLISPPLEIFIEPNERLKPFVSDGSPAKPGLRLTKADGTTVEIADGPFDRALETAGVAAGDSFTLEGRFYVDQHDTYQFHLRHAMKLEMRIDDRLIYSAERDSPQRDYVGLALERGSHKLALRGVAGNSSALDVRFGLRGVRRMVPAAFVHTP